MQTRTLRRAPAANDEPTLAEMRKLAKRAATVIIPNLEAFVADVKRLDKEEAREKAKRTPTARRTPARKTATR